MPATNPRISVTITPQLAAVLGELCQLTGNSRSATVGELLEVALPVFERVLAGIRAAKQIQDTARGEIAAGLERAQAKVEQQLGLALADMDEGFRPLLEAAEAVRRRGPKGGATPVTDAAAPARAGRRRASGAGSTPVPVTRGSGHPTGGKKGRGGGGRGRV